MVFNQTKSTPPDRMISHEKKNTAKESEIN